MPTFPGRWAAVSGMIEGSESALSRAVTEIYEETGMTHVRPVTCAMPVHVPVGRGVLWVYPFLFYSDTGMVRLNSENVSYVWVRPGDMIKYDMVPYLDVMLFGLVRALLGEHQVYAGATAHGAGYVVAGMLASPGVYEGSLLGIN